MNFKEIITVSLNFLSKSIQTELDQFLRLTNSSKKEISQQAFSKARQHIKPQAFQELFQVTANEAIQADVITSYKGFRLFAIDGTELVLDPSKELKNLYPGRSHEGCKARASLLCEIGNGIVIDGLMTPLSCSERNHALYLLENFLPIKQESDVVIFDRGYPSYDLLSYLTENRINYLMRIQKSFSPLIDSSVKEDFWISLKKKEFNCEVRILKVPLDSGEIELLVTNLTEDQLKNEEFKELYFKRWQIETRFNTLKHKLKIEQFAGKTEISIQQDFYATLYLSNIVTFLKMAADEEIHIRDQKKNKRYNYQANESTLISGLKDQLILIIMLNSSKKRDYYLEQLIHRAAKHCSPIRKGRHYKRPKDWHSARTKPRRKNRKEI